MHVYIDLFYTWDKVLHLVSYRISFSLPTHTKIIIATKQCVWFSIKKIRTHIQRKEKKRQVFDTNHTPEKKTNEREQTERKTTDA